ncbi:MAG: hypothetical protein IIB81_03540 [Nanoarchaeota archaeon]|nr:hypothetical protein [Nanoarchaeota archaeon]
MNNQQSSFKLKVLFLLAFSILFLPFSSALTSGEGTILFGAIFSMTVVVVFFLIMSIIIQNGPMKIFFMGLSFLTILSSVGISSSVMQEFFSDLTNINDTYGSFYILLVTLSFAGLMALILWLVIVAFKSFYSYRGIIDSEIN